MAHFPHPHSSVRAPRVRVPNAEPVIFIVDGKKVPAVLQKLSITGGVARLSVKIISGTLAELKLNTMEGPVSGIVEILAPIATAGLPSQPFRFIALNEDDHKRLKATLLFMRKNGLGESILSR